MAKKSFYTLDSKKKTITIYKYLEPTDTDLKMIQMYLSCGYSVIEVEKMERKTDGLTEAKILKALGNDAKKKAEYDKIKKDKGFFAAKQWYKENC